MRAHSRAASKRPSSLSGWVANAPEAMESPGRSRWGRWRPTWDYDSATGWWWRRWWRPWRGHRRRRRRRTWSRRTLRWVKVTVTKPTSAPGTSLTPGVEHVASAPGIAHTAHSPVIENVALRPAVTDATPAPVCGDVAPAPAVIFNPVIETHTAPTPATKYMSPAPAVTSATQALPHLPLLMRPRGSNMWHWDLPMPMKRPRQRSSTCHPHPCSSDRVRGYLTCRCIYRACFRDRIRVPLRLLARVQLQ